MAENDKTTTSAILCQNADRKSKEKRPMYCVCCMALITVTAAEAEADAEVVDNTRKLKR